MSIELHNMRSRFSSLSTTDQPSTSKSLSHINGTSSSSAFVHNFQGFLTAYYSETERVLIASILTHYYQNRDVQTLAHRLAPYTAENSKLVALLCRVLPRGDQKRFKYLCDVRDFEPLSVQTVDETVNEKARINVNGNGNHNTPRDKDVHVRSYHSDDVDGAGIGSLRQVFLQPADGSLGFTLRGGSEHGVGLYISSVQEDSEADAKGLKVGDEVVAVNKQSLLGLSHNEAVSLLKVSQSKSSAYNPMVLTVKFSGKHLPGSPTPKDFTWVDVQGRPVSPPSPAQLPGQGYKHIFIQGQPLGISVRGGADYGLGVFVSGVDAFSAAEQGGLKIGDEILAVNNQSLLDKSHEEAVLTLRGAAKLLLTVRRVGKLPYAKSSFTQSQRWQSEPALTNHSTDHITGLVNEITNDLLEPEHASSLIYYLEEYTRGQVHIRGLVLALRHLLADPEKARSVLRPLLRPADRPAYDMLLSSQQDNQYLTYFPPDSSDTDGGPAQTRSQNKFAKKRQNMYQKAALPSHFSPTSLDEVIHELSESLVRHPPSDDSGVEVLINGITVAPEASSDIESSDDEQITPRNIRVLTHSEPRPREEHHLIGRHSYLLKNPPSASRMKDSATGTVDFHGVDASTVTEPGVVNDYKTQQTLGLAIEGGGNPRQPLPKIINVQPGGSAYESGGLRVGQVILAVDGVAMKGLEHKQAARVIAESFRSTAQPVMRVTVAEIKSS